MGFCQFLDLHGRPPEDCSLLAGYLDLLVEELSNVNQTRFIETSDAPTASSLTALWLPCEVPVGAMAFWWYTAPFPYLLYQWFFDETEHWVLLDVR